ncbi:MAG: response regulator [Enhydrobacter sp.]|nr:MAG: response regulator [Enhydrobacter sp.]
MTALDLARDPRPAASPAPSAVASRTAVRRPSLLARGIWLAVAYLVVTGGMLLALLMQLREEAIDARKRELAAFAQLTASHTFEVALALEQSLRLAELTLTVATESGAATQETIGPMLREVVRGSRALEDVVVLDARGRVIFQAVGTGAVGRDWSNRSYFERARGASARFELAAPTRDGAAGAAQGWSIPVIQPWRKEGQFAGAIVGLMAPEVFDKSWTFDAEVDGLSIALVDNGGRAIMRRPFVDSLAGRPLGGPELVAQLARERAAGALDLADPADGGNGLVAYRRLTAYPELVVLVAQPLDAALADWRRIAWISGGCWVLASLALGGLGLWLVREMKARGALENRYEALFNSIPHPVILSDHESGRLLACNEAAAATYGAPFDGTAGDTALLPSDFAVLRARRGELSRDFACFIGDQRHIDRHGRPIDLELMVRLVDHDGRPADLTVAVDVTDRMKAERARRAAEDQLRQSQKMDTLGQLSGGIAHDFNNVLMVIVDTADEISEIENLPAEARRAAARISDSAGRAEELTRKMLAFSRRQPLRPRPVDVNDLVADTGKLLRRTLGEQIEIDSILADDLWPAEVDPVQLETSLVNLCLNARDAMPRGGRVLVETSNVRLDAAPAAARSGPAAGDFVAIRVSDSGHGILPGDIDKIFEPFFTTKASGKGSGLGLSMVYGFVRQSNGHIEVESELDRGTTFTLYLPRHRGSAVLTVAPSRAAMTGGSERVLVVEDDAHVRAAVVRQLQSLGYDVTSAENGAAGMAALEQAAFDLLLTDVVMPGGMNGKMLADEAARRWPAMAVVFMSGYTDNALIFGGAIADDIRLLGKPFRKRDLAQMIREALDVRPGAAGGPSS